MNKYLKAWIKIKPNLQDKDDIAALDELVTKSLDAKPIYYFEKEWGGWCECPFCNEEVDEKSDRNFCQSCGQALVWSEDV